MASSKGWGMRGMTLQAKFTAIEINLKRIANLIGEKRKETKENEAAIPQFSFVSRCVLRSSRNTRIFLSYRVIADN